MATQNGVFLRNLKESQALPLKTRSGLIAAQNPTVRSQSYTGTDIRVFVHVPDNDALQRDRKLLEELERQLNSAEQNAKQTPRSVGFAVLNSITRVKQQIQAANYQKFRKGQEKKQLQASLDNKLAAVSGFPAFKTLPKGHEQATILELTEAINNVDATLVGFDKEITTLSGKLHRLEEFSAAHEGRVNRVNITEKRIAEIETRIGKLVSHFEIGNLQTISLQTFRDKTPVRALGHSYPKAYVRGGRTIAGTMVFTIFDKDVLWDLLGGGNVYDFDNNTTTAGTLDQLPPLDMTILFASELGNVSVMKIYGLEFMSNGMVMGVEDLLTESTVQWVARDLEPMRKFANNEKISHINPSSQALTQKGSNLWKETDEYLRHKDRFNPFI